MVRQFENLQFDNKSNLGIIQIIGRRCTHSGPPVKLRFTALYTFPPLYTQKPAARRVFVFSEGGLRCPVFSARQVWRLKIADRGPSAASLRVWRQQKPPSVWTGALSFTGGYDMIWLGVVDKRQAVAPSGPTLCGQGRFFAPPTVRKGGLTMVTYSDLIQTGILIIGLIDLVLRLMEADRNHRQ